MKFYWIIRFNGFLNEKHIICNLIVIRWTTNSQMPYLFDYNMTHYLRDKKVEELENKNGSVIFSFLEVKNLFTQKFVPNLEIVEISSLDVDKAYKEIKCELNKAISEKIKIKIKKKGE